MRIIEGVWKDWEVFIRSDDLGLGKQTSGRLTSAEHQAQQLGPRGVRPGVILLYVESVFGKPFEIVVTRPADNSSDVNITYEVDGRGLRDNIMTRHQASATRSDFLVNVGRAPCTRHLMFGELNLTEEDGNLTDEELAQLGTINVTLTSGLYGSGITAITAPNVIPRYAFPSSRDVMPEARRPKAARTESGLKPLVVSESKKLLIGMIATGGPAQVILQPSLSAQLSSPRRSAKSRTVISRSRSSTLIIPPPAPCVFLANPSIPECKITFTYRSRELLMAQDILPRPVEAKIKIGSDHQPVHQKVKGRKKHTMDSSDDSVSKSAAATRRKKLSAVRKRAAATPSDVYIRSSDSE